MKYFVLFIATALLVGLCAVGQVVGAGHEEMAKSPMDTSSMGEKAQMQPMAGHNLNQEQIREMQNLLNDQGFNAGPADGFMGPRTRVSISQFQESEGLTATGNPDQETLRALSPSAEKQEFFGLSPEFGETMQEPMQPEGEQMKHMMKKPSMEQPMKQMMEKLPMEHKPMKQEGSKY
jgi:peptidoglycan hydrolase-like protein with peptidoglycan-binding domain